MTTVPKATPASGKQIFAPLQSLVGGRILALRAERVMLDADRAELYGVQTKVLVQAVNRNLARFLQDFMFQFSVDEFTALRSQTVRSNSGRGGRRTAPYAFTEQGVAMLSSGLGSPRAIGVNIEIMRTFVRLRELAATHSELAKRLSELEEKTESLSMQHDTFSSNTRNQLKQVFDALHELMTLPDPPTQTTDRVCYATRAHLIRAMSKTVANPPCPRVTSEKIVIKTGSNHRLMCTSRY